MVGCYDSFACFVLLRGIVFKEVLSTGTVCLETLLKLFYSPKCTAFVSITGLCVVTFNPPIERKRTVTQRKSISESSSMRYFVMILFNYSEVRDFAVQHRCGRTWGLVDRRGGSGEGASWEASQRRPQEDAEGMPIRHTEHCTYF